METMTWNGMLRRGAPGLGLVLACLCLVACKSVGAPRSWQASTDHGQVSSANASAVTACAAARAAAGNPDKAIDCANALATAYDDTALMLADKRQKFRHGEITLSILSLGLAGFEAHVDTLKGAGLIAGGTTAFKGAQQFAERIAAMDEGSQRYLCVVEKARKAQAARVRQASFIAQLQGLTQQGANASLFASPALAFTGGDAKEPDERLYDAVLDAVRRIESAAMRRYRFSEDTRSPNEAISDAIEKAIALGKSEEAGQAGTQQLFNSLNAKTETDAAALRALAGAMEEQTAFDKAVIEVSACPAL